MRKGDEGDEIHITQEKTGTEISIPVHENLLQSLKATPAKGLTLIGSPQGRPMTARGLSELVPEQPSPLVFRRSAYRTACARPL
jgi:hypothetical protein